MTGVMLRGLTATSGLCVNIRRRKQEQERTSKGRVSDQDLPGPCGHLCDLHSVLRGFI